MAEATFPSRWWLTEPATPGIKLGGRRLEVTAKLLEVKEELRRRMRRPIPEQGWLKWVVSGFFNYHAVPPTVAPSRCSDTASRFSGNARYRSLATHATASQSGWPGWWTTGSPERVSFVRAKRALCPQTPEVGARHAGKSARTVVCPGKASMFRRGQTCRGSSQSPVVRIAEEMETKPSKPIDKTSPGEVTSYRAVTKVNALWPRKWSIPEARAATVGRRRHEQSKSDRYGWVTSAGWKRQHGDKDMPSNWRSLLVPVRNHRSKVGRITGPTGKSAEDERVAAGSVVCAGQRHDQEGSSPSGARMRGAVSKGGGNASLAGERKVWRTLYGHEGESRIQPRGPEATAPRDSGGQGVRREAESEGHAEKYRAVVDGGHPDDEPVGQRWGKVEPALWGRRRSHPPTVSRCLRTARYGRSRRDPRRTRSVLGWHREKRPYKRKRSGKRCRASRRTAE